MLMQLHAHARISRKVLIVEDDEAISQLVKEALDAAGFQTDCVRDGVEAINQVLESKPDIVVLDLTIPRLSGFEICAMVRKSRTVGLTPIVVISGRDSQNDKLQAFEIGADDYVTKPFSIRELVARVQAVLERSRHDHSYTHAFLRAD